MRTKSKKSDAPIAAAFFILGVLALIPSLWSLWFFIANGIKGLGSLQIQQGSWWYDPVWAFGFAFFILWGLVQFVGYGVRMTGRRWMFKPTTLWASTIAYNAIIFVGSAVKLFGKCPPDSAAWIVVPWTGFWLMLGVVAFVRVIRK